MKIIRVETVKNKIIQEIFNLVNKDWYGLMALEVVKDVMNETYKETIKEYANKRHSDAIQEKIKDMIIETIQNADVRCLPSIIQKLNSTTIPKWIREGKYEIALDNNNQWCFVSQ